MKSKARPADGDNNERPFISCHRDTPDTQFHYASKQDGNAALLQNATFASSKVQYNESVDSEQLCSNISNNGEKFHFTDS
jgi:hypothetical protein